MAIINGTVWLLALGGTDLPDQTEGSISFNMDMIDITTKDSSGMRELLPGFFSGSPGAIPGTGIVIKRQGGL